MSQSTRTHRVTYARQFCEKAQHFALLFDQIKCLVLLRKMKTHAHTIGQRSAWNINYVWRDCGPQMPLIVNGIGNL